MLTRFAKRKRADRIETRGKPAHAARGGASAVGARGGTGGRATAGARWLRRVPRHDLQLHELKNGPNSHSSGEMKL